MLKRCCFFLLSSVLMYAGVVNAVGDIAAGKEKAATCVACHGADGNGVDAIPSQPRLAGQSAEYLEKQMHDFKSEKRKNAIMAPWVASLSDDDISNLAAYYESLDGTIGATAPEHVEAGQKLYRAGDMESGLSACMACHGPSGKGNPAAKYPSLTGQYAEYTSAQLKAFKSEQRANDTDAVMRDIAARMTNEEIEAVSSYIEGLH